MMQMLQAGGMNILSDGKRKSDPSNPRGYFEWEPIKQIGRNPDLLDPDRFQNSAIKVVTPLLSAMPTRHRYLVIFMQRPIAEVAASQQQMLQHQGADDNTQSPEDLIRSLTQHRTSVLNWLENARHCEVLVVDYPSLINAPDAAAARIAEFLGPDLLPKPSAMGDVVRPELYRQRQT